MYSTFSKLNFSLFGPTTTVISPIPFFTNNYICLSIIDFPLIGTSGFGSSVVKLPNLVPEPAAIKITFMANSFN